MSKLVTTDPHHLSDMHAQKLIIAGSILLICVIKL